MTGTTLPAASIQRGWRSCRKQVVEQTLSLGRGRRATSGLGHITCRPSCCTPRAGSPDTLLTPAWWAPRRRIRPYPRWRTCGGRKKIEDPLAHHYGRSDRPFGCPSQSPLECLPGQKRVRLASLVLHCSSSMLLERSMMRNCSTHLSPTLPAFLILFLSPSKVSSKVPNSELPSAHLTSHRILFAPRGSVYHSPERPCPGTVLHRWSLDYKLK